MLYKIRKLDEFLPLPQITFKVNSNGKVELNLSTNSHIGMSNSVLLEVYSTLIMEHNSLITNNHSSIVVKPGRYLLVSSLCKPEFEIRSIIKIHAI